MKKFSIIALALILTFALAACGRKNNTETTPTSTTPSTSTTTRPSMDPTFETNIPDPSVDTSMPDMTDMIDGTDSTDNTDMNNNAKG